MQIYCKNVDLRSYTYDNDYSLYLCVFIAQVHCNVYTGVTYFLLAIRKKNVGGKGENVFKRNSNTYNVRIRMYEYIRMSAHIFII